MSKRGQKQETKGVRAAGALSTRGWGSFVSRVPSNLRHGVAMEVLEQHHDLEEVRALLGHSRMDTTPIYASSRPSQLKRAVAFYEE